MVALTTKIAGVTFDDRQDTIAKCKEGEKVTMKQGEKGALEVTHREGSLGFIPKANKTTFAKYDMLEGKITKINKWSGGFAIVCYFDIPA